MSEDKHQHWLHKEKNKNRLIFFCDAIFAIAITILILQIDVPEIIYTDNLGTVIQDLWPRLISFVISFFVISRFWITHLNLYNYVKVLDIRIVVINLFFMGCIVFLPFATDFYGAHSANKYVLAFYVLTIVVTSFTSYMMWNYALRHRDLLYENADSKALRRRAWHGLMVPAEFLIALGIIFLFPSLIEWYWLFFLGISALIITTNHLIERYENKESRKISH